VPGLKAEQVECGSLTMSKPGEAKLEKGELLVRNTGTGELTPFAAATVEEDAVSFQTSLKVTDELEAGSASFDSLKLSGLASEEAPEKRELLVGPDGTLVVGSAKEGEDEEGPDFVTAETFSKLFKDEASDLVTADSFTKRFNDEKEAIVADVEAKVSSLNDKLGAVITADAQKVVKLEKLEVSGKVQSDISMEGNTLTAGKLVVKDTATISGDVDVSGETVLRQSLSVLGTVMGSGAYVDSSDERLKSDVEELGVDLDRQARFEALRPVSYNFRTADFSERNLPEGRQFGFLAQEVEQIYPEVVTTDADGFKYVSYTKVVPLLVQEAHDLRATVGAQQEQMREMQEQIKLLAEGLREMQQKSSDRRDA